MKINLGCSDDYANLDFGDMNYYYGYEYTNEDEVGEENQEWCFVVLSDKKILFQKTESELLEAAGEKREKWGSPWSDMPERYLVVGMCLFHQEYARIDKEIKDGLVVEDKINKFIDALSSCSSAVDDLGLSLVEEFG